MILSAVNNFIVAFKMNFSCLKRLKPLVPLVPLFKKEMGMRCSDDIGQVASVQIQNIQFLNLIVIFAYSYMGIHCELMIWSRFLNFLQLKVTLTHFHLYMYFSGYVSVSWEVCGRNTTYSQSFSGWVTHRLGGLIPPKKICPIWLLDTFIRVHVVTFYPHMIGFKINYHWMIMYQSMDGKRIVKFRKEEQQLKTK